jgi:hypothetical protein
MSISTTPTSPTNRSTLMKSGKSSEWFSKTSICSRI